MKLLITGTFYCLAIGFAVWYVKGLNRSFSSRPLVNTLEGIEALFPSDKRGIEQLVEKTEADTQKGLQALLTYNPYGRTVSNPLEALDCIEERVGIAAASLELVALLSPDQELRSAARQGLTRLGALNVDALVVNPELYKVFVAYESFVKDPQNKVALSDVQRYALDQKMKNFRKEGLDLSLEQQNEIKSIKKELTEVALAFDKNITDDQRFIEVSAEDLKGLDESFIQSLEKLGNGFYKLTVDDPTYCNVMEECSVQRTRELLYKQYAQRGYPANEETLKRLWSLRQKLSQLCGYKSYAHYDIDDQMAKNPETVQLFLDDIAKRIEEKNLQELESLKRDIPQGVCLSPEGLMYPWDLRYLQTYYKKKHIDLDEQRIAEYFPLEHALESLLTIYEKFFGLSFKPLESLQVWHSDVRGLAVYKDGQYYGAVLLDLFPRPYKFTHAAQIAVVPSVKAPSKMLHPSVVCVITNFPRATEDKPSLLTRKDLTTFFHEFGHAIHSLLGATEIAALSGTRVKGDFVEMPSQMLEEWLTDPGILSMISKHYKTGERIPQELIEKIQLSKNLFSADQITRLIFGSYVSLFYFLSPDEKEIGSLWKSYYKKLFPMIMYDEDNRGYCAFLHLSAYGAKYYGYAWSKVYALDLFSTIKQQGLLQSPLAERYSNEVIGKGGSQDPYLLLTSFLGREPRSDAFFQDIGVYKKP